jgi:hypothetical protein
MKLEPTLLSLLHDASPETPALGLSFKVIAYEMTMEDSSWSVNSPFCILRDGDLTALLETVRGRWETFKVNYCPRARVSSIHDIEDYHTNVMELEAEGIPFLQVSWDAEA